MSSDALSPYGRLCYVWDRWQTFSEDAGQEEEASCASEDDDAIYISCVQFDPTGVFLAIGYSGGQVVVLRYCVQSASYCMHTEFVAFVTEFDVLTSDTVLPHVNSISWFPYRERDRHSLLVANDKKMKLFVMEDEKPAVFAGNPDAFAAVKERCTYVAGHEGDANGAAFTTDGETFLSCDATRVNLWNLRNPKDILATVDFKRSHQHDEFITAIHPSPCDASEFVYATTGGLIKMGDLRRSSLCDAPAKIWRNTRYTAHHLGSLGVALSDVKISPNGLYILSRDAMTMKIWDVRYEACPVKAIPVFETLVDLAEMAINDGLYDTFGTCWSGDSTRVLTGSYGGSFYVCDAVGGNGRLHMAAGKTQARRPVRRNDHFHDSRKVLHAAYSPTRHHICLGRRESGFLHRQVLEVDLDR